MTVAVRRREVLTGLAAVTAGCTGSDGGTAPADTTAAGEVTPMGDLELTSPAFDDGEPIPRKYGKSYEDVNPALDIANVPADAESLALVMDDPDAPGGTFTHWLAWNIPPDVGQIPENWDPPGRVVAGENDFGDVGYSGPRPPEEHTYRFTLSAVESTLDLDASATREELREAVGEPLARARLTGTFAP